MGLDINTPKGRESLKLEMKMLEYISDCWDVEIIETNKEKTSCCDGFLVKNNTIIGLFEDKCRKLTINELEDYGSWLITHQKLIDCKTISELLKVPFFGFLYLVKSNVVMFWKITDSKGEYCFAFDNMPTTTQKTINGGQIIRDNAFLPFLNGNVVSKTLFNKDMYL